MPENGRFGAQLGLVPMRKHPAAARPFVNPCTVMLLWLLRLGLSPIAAFLFPSSHFALFKPGPGNTVTAGFYANHYFIPLANYCCAGH